MLWVVLLAAVPGWAEFRWVELQFGGMECASCSTFVEEKLTKNRNVEAVELNAAKGLLKVKLKAGTRMKAEQVRDLVQQSGYTVSEVRASVAGTVMEEGGKWTVTVPEPNAIYRLSLDAGMGKAMREHAGKAVVLEGVVKGDELVVRGVEKLPKP